MTLSIDLKYTNQSTHINSTFSVPMNSVDILELGGTFTQVIQQNNNADNKPSNLPGGSIVKTFITD